MEALINELLKQKWDCIYNELNTDKAYDEFLKLFKVLYDKNCPVKQYGKKLKYKENLWMSNGLQNACKKKNTLHREFIKLRTKEAENRYKTYKNKLINIIRNCKKEYYNKLLENNKHNIKGIWNILNSIIRNKTRQIDYPKYFIENDKIIDDTEDIANNLNYFFVNIGPKLAEEIPDTPTGIDNLIERNPMTMFLKPVEEMEIIDIVNECKSKSSPDFNDIDMKIVKKVIHGISKPLTHIFNLSLKNGQFPNNMKLLKSFLYSKLETNTFSQTIDQFLFSHSSQKFWRKYSTIG